METIPAVVFKQRQFFKTGATLPYEYRLRALGRLEKWLIQNESDVLRALLSDLGKAPFEGYETEFAIVMQELRHAKKHLRDWMKPRRVKTPLTQFPSKSYRYPEPYGVTLIMSPWNYPFQLTVTPLIGALAAGNCAVVKPSAYSAETSALLRRMAEAVFPDNYVTVIEGGRAENQALLLEQFDYIFFTGSVTVGKLVMESAAKYLTPVSLELGGKSPCIVDDTADLPLAAKRIVWGKFLNAGQTCVAPDYLLVQESVKERLVKELLLQVKALYGENPLENSSFPTIINQHHYERLLALTEGETILTGGVGEPSVRRIAPTILDNVNWDSPVMQEEIFGPILPILTFRSLRDAVNQVSERPKPLAFYFFTTSRERKQWILSRCSFGGGCINDTIVHLANPNLPFGGVGESGMGSYHGSASFFTFSHVKSVLEKSNRLDIPLRYPPYDGHLKLLRKLF